MKPMLTMERYLGGDPHAADSALEEVLSAFEEVFGKPPPIRRGVRNRDTGRLLADTDGHRYQWRIVLGGDTQTWLSAQLREYRLDSGGSAGTLLMDLGLPDWARQWLLADIFDACWSSEAAGQAGHESPADSDKPSDFWYGSSADLVTVLMHEHFRSEPQQLENALRVLSSWRNGNAGQASPRIMRLPATEDDERRFLSQHSEQLEASMSATDWQAVAPLMRQTGG